MDQSIISEIEHGRPIFLPVLLELGNLDRLCVRIAETDKNWLGWVNHNIPNYFNLNRRKCSFLNLDEMVVTFLHEMHHLNLDFTFFNEFEDFLKSFPIIDITSFREGYNFGRFPIENWYARIRNGGLRNDWNDIIQSKNVKGEKPSEIEVMRLFADLCKEEVYDISSYNILHLIKSSWTSKYYDIHFKIAQAV